MRWCGTGAEDRRVYHPEPATLPLGDRRRTERKEAEMHSCIGIITHSASFVLTVEARVGRGRGAMPPTS